MSFSFQALFMVGSLALASAAHAAFPPEQIEFFEKSIRPLLAERCYDCHSATKHENGLRLDVHAEVLRGSDYGKVVEPGNPAASKLIKAVKHLAGVEPMPKKQKALKPEEMGPQDDLRSRPARDRPEPDLAPALPEASGHPV